MEKTLHLIIPENILQYLLTLWVSNVYNSLHECKVIDLVVDVATSDVFIVTILFENVHYVYALLISESDDNSLKRSFAKVLRSRENFFRSIVFPWVVFIAAKFGNNLIATEKGGNCGDDCSIVEACWWGL